ncbi:MAG: signal peptidase I [Clostridia bacterium]|nr:signal peptidase I [Clostridia bacterium]NCC44274.1 signal peptidase I [Clostridia bacterium]
MAAAKVKSVFLWIIEIIAVIGIGFVLAVGFGKTTVMQEGSMDPTMAAGDTMLINRAAYKIGTPKRGDIIAYKLSDDEKASTHIKRIIGLPGETVQIKDGQILIDGETYQEQKNFPAIQNPGIAETSVTLGSGEYFVLGDNRNNSEDSRFVDVGNVKKKNIIGKLWFVVSPWEKFGILKK